MATSRRTTMADVARHAGVALSTVSLAYSGTGPISAAMRQRVEAAAQALGYAGPYGPARALRSGRSQIIGAVVHDRFTLAFQAPHVIDVMDGLISELGDLGLGVLVIPPLEQHSDHAQLLESAPMDAAVILRLGDRHEPAITVLERRSIPFVVMDAQAPSGAGEVSIDDRAATITLIDHLRELGHDRIGTVTLPHAPGQSTRIRDPRDISASAWAPMRERLAAFASAGVEPCVVVEARESLVEEGITAGHLALTHPSRPTALVVQSDVLAGGVVRAADQLGISVPHEVSVTGFDGSHLPWLAPLVLTTISQDGVAKGRAVATQVATLLDGGTPTRQMLPLTFRVGNSTGPVNHTR